MGEAKNRRMRGLPPNAACAVGAQRMRQGVFTLPSGKVMTVSIPENLSADDADVASVGLARLSLELAAKAEGSKTGG